MSLRNTKDYFLISHLAAQRPALTLNSMLNKKIYMLKMMLLHPNLAASARVVYIIINQKHDRYMNTFNHLFSSDKQRITIFQ